MASVVKLFVAGIPGTGKTFFGDKLRDKFGFMHVDLESGLQRILVQCYQWNLSAFLQEMSQCSRCFVATWGFTIGSIPIVEPLADSDIRLVWFDGNREFARKAWLTAKGRTDDTDFRRQVEAIDSRLDTIKGLFWKDWIDVFSPEGNPLSCEQILDRLSIRHFGIAECAAIPVG
jgi:hypothetical protein